MSLDDAPTKTAKSPYGIIHAWCTTSHTLISLRLSLTTTYALSPCLRKVRSNPASRER